MNTTNIGNAPTREYKVLLQGNSVVGIVPHWNPCFSANHNDWTKEDINYLLASKSWNYEEAKKMMMCESSGNPSAINWLDNHGVCMGSFGLLQMGCFRGTQEELFNPEINIRLAYELYKRNGGWSRDWVNCWSKIRQ